MPAFARRYIRDRRPGCLQRLYRCSGGSMAVEFAFIAPVLAALIFGIVEYGRFLWLRTTVEQGVESAARYGVFQYKQYKEQSIADWVTPTKTYAAQELFGIDNLSVTVTPNVVTLNGIGMIEVQASYNFSPLVPGLTYLLPQTVTLTTRQAAQ